MAQKKEDWQFGKDLSQRMKYMLDNQLMSDVNFLVGSDKTEIFAHKYMLASASPVFSCMFEGPLAEAGDVVVPDIEPDIFEDVLKFIYTDYIHIDSNNVNGVLYASEKYMLQSMKDECSNVLSSGMNDTNACVVFQTAHDFGMDDLKKEAFDYILTNGEVCIGEQTFLKMSPECMKIIIGSDKLVCREEVVYERVVEWAKYKLGSHCPTDEEIREKLGELLYFVRFPIMDPEYFKSEISVKKILTPEEMFQVYQSHNNMKSELFSSATRLSPPIDFLRCSTFFKKSWSHNGPSDCLDFQTNFDCICIGIKVFGSAKYEGVHDIKVDIKQGTSTLATQTNILHSDEGTEMYNVYFNNKPYLKKEVRYTIELNMKGQSALRGENYITNVVEKDFCVKFIRSTTSPNSTTENDGQIPGLVLQPI